MGKGERGLSLFFLCPVGFEKKTVVDVVSLLSGLKNLFGMLKGKGKEVRLGSFYLGTFFSFARGRLPQVARDVLSGLRGAGRA